MKDTSYLVQYSLLGLLIGALLYYYSPDGVVKDLESHLVQELKVETAAEEVPDEMDSKLEFETSELVLEIAELEAQSVAETNERETNPGLETPDSMVQAEVETEATPIIETSETVATPKPETIVETIELEAIPVLETSNSGETDSVGQPAKTEAIETSDPLMVQPAEAEVETIEVEIEKKKY